MRVAALACVSLLVLVGAAKPDPLMIKPGADLYPPEAVGIDGDVPVTLAVDPSGNLRCLAGSGPTVPAALRRASCVLIAARDVFAPRQENGKPVATSYDFVVRWRKSADNAQFGGAIPIARARWIKYTDYPSIAFRKMDTGRVRVEFVVSAAGRVADCRVTKTNAGSTLADQVCPLLQQRAVFLPALGKDNRPTPANGWFNVDWRWCGDSKGVGCPSPDAGP